jgi:hypothetical protein
MKKLTYFYILIGILINCTSYETKNPMTAQGGFIVKKDFGDETLLFCNPPKDAERAYCYEVKEKQ